MDPNDLSQVPDLDANLRVRKGTATVEIKPYKADRVVQFVREKLSFLCGACWVYLYVFVLLFIIALRTSPDNPRYAFRMAASWPVTMAATAFDPN